jgi:hypothetical protein
MEAHAKIAQDRDAAPERGLDANMTQLLEQAFTKAAQLPSQDQDTIATLILKEIEAEQRWDDALANSPDTLSQLADEALSEHRAGKTKRLNLADL